MSYPLTLVGILECFTCHYAQNACVVTSHSELGEGVCFFSCIKNYTHINSCVCVGESCAPPKRRPHAFCFINSFMYLDITASRPIGNPAAIPKCELDDVTAGAALQLGGSCEIKSRWKWTSETLCWSDSARC